MHRRALAGPTRSPAAAVRYVQTPSPQRRDGRADAAPNLKSRLVSRCGNWTERTTTPNHPRRGRRPWPTGCAPAAARARHGCSAPAAARRRRPGCEAVILAVPDAAIAPLARALPPGPAVGHCAGALGPRRARPARAALLAAPADDADTGRRPPRRCATPAPPSPGRRPDPPGRTRGASGPRERASIRSRSTTTIARTTTPPRASRRTSSSRSKRSPRRLFALAAVERRHGARLARASLDNWGRRSAPSVPSPGRSHAAMRRPSRDSATRSRRGRRRCCGPPTPSPRRRGRWRRRHEDACA